MNGEIPPAAEADHDRSSAPASAGRPRWLTSLLAVGALLAALLLGGAGGMLLAGSSGGQWERPSAVDIGFAQDMAAHHRQGVLMASLTRERSTDPEIRQLAIDIEHTQTEQMGRMHGWLALWSQPMRPAGERMSWMSGAGHGMAAMDPARMMPGMATPAELERLRGLSGKKFDVYFLQLMLRHHQGGVPMLREAIERAAVDDVRNLARQMLTAQSSEVKVMTRMLRERGAEPLRPPM